jgi:hypothetical protein
MEVCNGITKKKSRKGGSEDYVLLGCTSSLDQRVWGQKMTSDLEKAFAVGWQVAQLYHSPVHESPTGHGKLSPRLPGRSALPEAEQSLLLARQVEGGIQALLMDLTGSPLAAAIASAEGLLRGVPRIPVAVQQAIWDLHVEAFEALTVKDFQLGKAYGLGRALAETAIMAVDLPVSERPPLYSELFSTGRLEQIAGWLSELKSSFEPHASYAVYGSLSRWAAWMDGADRPKFGDPGAVLARQGHVWRSVLSGEKQATDLLKATDFLQAGIALLRRFSELSRRFFWSGYLILLLVIFGAVVAAVIGISDLSSVSQTSRLAAQLVVILGTLGVTTKGVTSTLGRIIAKAQGELWDSEIDESCAVAACRLPSGVRIDRRPSAQIGDMARTGIIPIQRN